MKKEEIRERLEHLPTERLIEVWNEYQFEISGEDAIYSIDYEFDEICRDMSPLEIAENVCGEHFNPAEENFIITPYGFESLATWEVIAHVNITELVDWIADDVRHLGLI